MAEITTIQRGLERLPANLEVEQALLAAIMANNACYDAVAKLGPVHFADELHGFLFDQARRMIEAGEQASAMTLWRRVPSQNEEDVEKLRDYIRALSGLAFITDPEICRGYAGEILDCWRRRSLMAYGQTVAATAADSSDGTDPLDFAEAGLQAIRDGEPLGSALRPLSEILPGALDEIQEARRRRAEGRTVGLSTGLQCLDDMLAGLHPGDLSIIAARPSMGKTALACGIAHAAACSGEQVLFFSREMTGEQIGARIVALRSGIDFDLIRKGELDDAEFDRILDQRAAVQDLPFTIDDDRSASTVSALRAAARLHKRRHGLALVVIDYLQLLNCQERAYRENRTQEVTAITRELTVMAGELKVPVVALCQLSRETLKREDKRPDLGDLRESGSIEQDADVVIFIHRPEYYINREEPRERRANETEEKFDGRRRAWAERSNRWRGKAELIIAKQRNGPPAGTAVCDFHEPTMRFSDEAARGW